MKLRFDLISSLPGPLPEACQLPEHYSLEVVSDREVCVDCGGPLWRVRTSTHYPLGLMLGKPRVRLVHKQCAMCHQVDALEAYYQYVPPAGNYAYDLIVEVGLARLRDHRQDAEIQRDLQQHWGWSPPASSIGRLAHAFLDGLAAIHRVHLPALRERLAEDGGYVLHLDGTCEPGTAVIFAGFAGARAWTLEVAKMTTENVAEISKLVRRCVDCWGTPRAVVRDLSKNIEKAKKAVIPDVPDLICHYHFLENVGTKLCEQPHAQLTNALRRLKIRPALSSLRKDVVRWSRKGLSLSASQIDQVFSHPEQIAELDAVASRRFVIYALLRWVEDFGADLRGEYFPFDLPSLAFYRRGRALGQWVSDLLAAEDFPQRDFATLQTMARHLATLREDPQVVAAAQRVEKASALFEELRQVLRLSSQPHEHWLRGQGPGEDRAMLEALPERLQQWCDRLRERHSRERDEDKRADQKTVLGYLDKYQPLLVGHVIPLPGREPLLVARTNNLAEQRFGATKQGARRKVGAKKLTRYLQAMRAEELLVANLADPVYVDIVCPGGLANLPVLFAKHWHLAQVVRQEHQEPSTDHPLPTTKKQIRHPRFLETIKQTIATIAAATSRKPNAA